MVAAPPLADSLAELWEPLPRLGGNEWAETYRVLGTDEVLNRDRAGPWVSFAWQRKILDALADPNIDWVAILKAAQMGISDIVRCAIGRWAHLDPGDVLWVMADRASAQKSMRKLRKMFRNCPVLRPLLSRTKDGGLERSDNTLLEMTLVNGMRIVIGWATSAASLSSDPFRFVVLDEVRLYPTAIGAESNPIQLAKARTKTAGRAAKVVVLSTPAHEDDLIMDQWGKTILQQRFGVECSCGAARPLQWDQVRWGNDEAPDTAPRDIRERMMVAEGLTRKKDPTPAWVECLACNTPLGDTRTQTELAGSHWIQADLDGIPTTHTVTESRRVAFHISELYHWETSTQDLVAKFLSCKPHKPREIQGFWNEALGLPLSIGGSRLRVELFEGRSLHAAGIVPEWATLVLATADTQLHEWWWTVRAWGANDRSRLIAWGRAETEEALKRDALDARFPIEGSEHSAGISMLLIDSGGGQKTVKDGSRTHQVYRFCKRYGRALAYKGVWQKESVDTKPWWVSKIDGGGELFHANANFWKDELLALILAEAPILWEESEAADTLYNKHMCAQHRVTEEDSRGVRKTLWKPRSGHARYDLWACAYMQVVLADYMGVSKRTATILDRMTRPGRGHKRAKKTKPYKVGR